MVKCLICGKQTEVFIDSKRKYCSRVCQRIGNGILKKDKTWDELYGVDKAFELRKNQSKIMKVIAKNLWNNPEYAKKVLHRRPMSGPESKFQKEYINKNNLPYFFNGNVSDKKIIIERKIPDFVHNTERKVIEIWGDFYHRGQNPQDRIDHFKRYDYDCLVIWASELKKYPDETLSKVAVFTENKI